MQSILYQSQYDTVIKRHLCDSAVMTVRLRFKKHASNKIIVTEGCSACGYLILMRPLTERVLVTAFRRKERIEQVSAVARYAAEQPVVRPFADCCYRHGRRVTIPESDRAT